jgi:acyl-CoA reductase-like NAD-dependent aldehyde dehydrogenase
MTLKTDIKYRKQKLKQLLLCIESNQKNISEALYKDLKKPEFEAFLTEISYTIGDLKNTIKNLESWAKPKRVLPSILNFPSSDFIYSEPYGKVLIISPWNYPFQLAFCPMIAAVAAGNTVVLKPSELTRNTSAIITKIITEVFDTNEVQVIEGDALVSQKLLENRWDYIFFTGSVAVGKIVAQAAAKNLTPTTLELGGKNPCIIDDSANLKLAAKRIVWGKFINAGQTCIAPDYLLVHANIKAKLIEYIKSEIEIAYSENPKSSPDLARIVNKNHWQRLMNLLDGNNIIYGGQADVETNFISPTLVEEPKLDSLLMKDEIFGPILPIISYNDKADLERIISTYEKPLALYVFTTQNTFAQQVINKFSFGGGCINDTLVHFSNKRLPFGGVGHSGIGAYHGKLGFDTFSHQKAIVKKANWLDLPLRYAPYKGKLKTIEKLMRWL